MKIQLNFAKDVGLLPKSVKCPTCSDILTKPYYVKNRKTTQIRYQCNKRQCHGSGKKNTVSLKIKKLVFKGVILVYRSHSS